MKIRTHIQTLLLFTCLTCIQAGNVLAQVLINTSWRPIDNLATALKNNGIDTLVITFMPNDRMEFRYVQGSSSTTSVGLWYQLGTGNFRFRDTSNSGLSVLCDPDDDAYVEYTIDTGVMFFANIQDSCGSRGALFTSSKWALVSGVVGIKESVKTVPYVQIYPNPSSGCFHIDFRDQATGNFDINIYDLSGKLVSSLQDISANVPEVDIPALPAGTYLARIVSVTGIQIISKIQIQH